MKWIHQVVQLSDGEVIYWNRLRGIETDILLVPGTDSGRSNQASEEGHDDEKHHGWHDV